MFLCLVLICWFFLGLHHWPTSLLTLYSFPEWLHLLLQFLLMTSKFPIIERTLIKHLLTSQMLRTQRWVGHASSLQLPMCQMPVRRLSLAVRWAYESQLDQNKPIILLCNFFSPLSTSLSKSRGNPWLLPLPKPHNQFDNSFQKSGNRGQWLELWSNTAQVWILALNERHHLCRSLSPFPHMKIRNNNGIWHKELFWDLNDLTHIDVLDQCLAHRKHSINIIIIIIIMCLLLAIITALVWTIFISHLDYCDHLLHVFLLPGWFSASYLCPTLTPEFIFKMKI